MHIRCERCSTVYEFDEKNLPPGGAPVQCTRCQHVFHAWPPQAAGRTLSMFPAAQGAAPVRPAAPGAARASSAAAGGQGGATAPAPPVSGVAPVAPAAAPRAAGPPAPEPAPARRPPAPPAPLASRRDRRSDTITMLVRQIRNRQLWRWLGPLLVLLAAGAGVAGYWYRSRQIDRAALTKREEGLRLLARDDSRSLEQAAETLAEASRLDARLFQARADRALALTLLSADERRRGAALESRFKALDAERVRLEAEGTEGWRQRQSEVVGEMQGLKDRIGPVQQRAGRLAGEAFGELKALVRPHGEDLAVARSLALYQAFDGNREQASRAIRNARASGEDDPWLIVAEGVDDLAAANSQMVRQQAVARLAPLASAHPDLLRARMLLARAEVDLGLSEAAVAVLDGVLEVNPAHEAAREMKERLLAPPPLDPLRAKVPQQAPPPGRPGTLPRRSGGDGH